MSRKSFLLSRGFTCANWAWSWAFINERERFIAFGLWDEYNVPGKSGLILHKDWKQSEKGHENRGYKEAIRYIELIEQHNFALYTFLMYEAPRTEYDSGPVKISNIQKELVPKRLLALPGGWYAAPVAEKVVSKSENSEFWDGTSYTVEMVDYERNAAARAKCLAKRGYKCEVCLFDFEEEFGKLGNEYIHVHHIYPLSASKFERKVNPEEDLVPLCPNCHAMAHRTAPITSVEDLIKLKMERKYINKAR